MKDDVKLKALKKTQTKIMLLGGKEEECCCVKKVRFNSVIAQYPHEHILYTQHT